MTGVATLLDRVRACRACAAVLPHAPRPVFQAHPRARILIASQAPGRRVHESGIPFDDVSGDRLRGWLGIDRETFYDPRIVAILPMGFCYPGTGRAGDLPPRPECAPLWRTQMLSRLRRIEVTLLVGGYAQRYHLDAPPASVTEAVRAWRDGWPRILPLPHPSPRNRAWFSRNPWFEDEVVPRLRCRVAEVVRQDRGRHR